MPYEIVFFPPEIIELNRELASGLHPRLEKMLEETPDASWEHRYAVIAAYCEVAMDGMYEVKTLCEVCEKELLPRLKQLRENPNQSIIIS